MEIEQKYTRVARTKVLQKIAMNIATYVARRSPYTRRYGKYVAPPTKSMS